MDGFEGQKRGEKGAFETPKNGPKKAQKQAEIRPDFLQEFVVVAREGSLTKAAETLGVSQSLLSRHMQALEAALKLKLLLRSTNGTELTREGRYVFEKAADIAEITDNIATYANTRKRAVLVPVLGLNFYPKQAKKLLVNTQKLTYNNRPIEVQLVGENTPAKGAHSATRLEDELDSGRADVLVLPAHGNLGALAQNVNHQYAVFPLFRSEIVAIMDPTNALAKYEALTPQHLDGRMLLHAEYTTEPERENWQDTKYTLRAQGVDFRSKTIPISTRDQAFLGDLGHGILLLAKAHEGVQRMRLAGNVVLPVQGLEKQFVGITRAKDRLAKKVLAAAFPGAVN